MTSSSPPRLTHFKLLLAALWLCGLAWLGLGLYQTRNAEPRSGWALAQRADLVGERVDGAAIESMAPLTIDANGRFSLGLNFFGHPISTQDVSQMRIKVQSQLPFVVHLLAQCQLDGPHFLSAPITLGDGITVIEWSDATLRFAPVNDATATPDCLYTRLASLSLQGQARQTLGIGEISLKPTKAQAAVALSAWTPEQWLWRRDQALLQTPGAVIVSPLGPMAQWLLGGLLFVCAALAVWQTPLLEKSPRPLLLTARPAVAQWLECANFTLFGLGAIALIGWLQGSALELQTAELARYLAFVPIQQLLLFGLLSGLVRKLTASDLSPLGFGLAFALLHTPNAALMMLTLGAGFFWAQQLRKHGSLWPILLSHLVLGLALGALSEGMWLRNLRAGLGFFG